MQKRSGWRENSRLTGESLTEAVRTALRQRCDRLSQDRGGKTLAERLRAIAQDCASLPDFDTRSPDEIIGYDEDGMW